MLKYVAIAWVRWNNEIARQLKLKEMYRRKRAAIKIQAHWRARTARMAARALRALLEKKRRVKSVVRIQRWYDCCRMRWAYNAMVRAKQQKAAATLLETRARMLLAKLKVNRVRFERKKVTSALLIQCFWRGRVERLFAMARLVERLEIKSATLIQAVARGRMGRLRVKKIRRHKVETQAALIIQTRARGISARLRCIRLRQERAKERQRLAKAALLVQKCYRGHRDRLKTRIIMNSIRQRRKLEERMAVFVQAAVRGLMTRKRIRMMREERDEALLNEARQFKEIEQDGGLCYQNVETGESVWSPPASGYVKTDGQLMLSTGKVIEDPLTNLTPEEKKARLMEKLCSECEDRNATRKCDQCGDKFCATCYIETHKQGARAQHVWQRLGHIECAECEGVPKAAVRWCVVCDDPFCALHWDDLHKHGARAMHPFCSIDSNGVIDYEASNSIGERQGKYAVGPPSVGGGDDGDGNLHPVAEEVEEDETFHEGGEEGGSVVTGEWAMFVDETNNNYRYNEATGETTYDDPNGVQEEGGGGGGGDEGGGNGEAEWTEFKDDEGNPYWHNTVTGDSTYDSPFT